jgi:hypothetical protein
MADLHAEEDRERARKKRDGKRSPILRRLDEPGSQAFELSAAIAQAKLCVGPAVDPYEREADAVADSVVKSIRSGGAASSGRAARRTEPAAQRIRRRAGSIGAAGGEVDGDTDRAIQSSRGGGAALPGDARSQMETAFGADFSGVRVHEGAQAADLSNRIQARAFTVGSDVYFRDGMPDTDSASGQHLLAHELTHTIQQGGASTFGGPQRVMSAGSVVQRRHEGTIVETQSYLIKKVDGVDGVTLSHKIPPGKKLKKMSSMGEKTFGGVKYVAIDTPSFFPRPPAWRQPPPVPPKRSASGRAVPQPPPSRPPPPPMYFVKKSAFDEDVAAKPETSLDKAIGGVDNANSVVGHAGIAGSIGGAKERLGSSDNLIKDSATKDNLGTAGDTVKGVTSLMTMASSIMKIKNAEGDSKHADRAAGAIDLVGATATTGSAVTSMVDRGGGLSADLKASKIEAGTATDDSHVLSDVGKASSGLAAFASVFEGIKATFGLVKKAIEIYKKNKPDGALSTRSKQERFHDAMAIIKSILEAAASGVSAAKGFLDAFGTGAGIGFSTAVPGFGVALGGAELIVRGVDAITASIHGQEMRKDKQASKTSDWVADPSFNPTVVAGVFPGGVETRGKKGTTHPIGKKFKELSKKSTRTAAEDAFVKWGETFGPMQAYLTNKGVQAINNKRARRAALKIGVAMTKVAGDIATLGGASAPVGMGLKAGAALIDGGCTIFRTIKQAGRDKAAKAAPGSRWSSVFNAEKSTGSKLAEYNKQVDRIFAQVVATSKLSDAEQKEAAKARIDRIFGAIGVHPERAWALASNISELRDELITYMKKRE